MLLTASKVITLALPLTLRMIVDTLSSDGEFRTAAMLVGAFCGLTVAADACVQLQSVCWNRVSQRITQRMSVALFEHLHALSLRWHLNRKTGEVLTVMNQGVNAVATMLQVVTFQISATALELLLTSAVFLKIGVPAISLCVIGGAVLYTTYTVVLTRMRTAQRREVNQATKRAQDAVVDSLLNFETVKLFACEKPEAERYDGLTRTLAQLSQRTQNSLSTLNWGQTLAMQLGMAGGLLVACASTTAAQMSVGDFVMVQLYITQLFRPLSNLGGNYRTLMQALTDIEKMVDLFNTPIEVLDRPGATDLTHIIRGRRAATRDVTFERVSFRYAVGGAGVSELTLRIPPGGSIALVGPSGSGKSTSTRLLCRLLEVEAGTVRVCGVDVRDVTQHSLRTVVSCVSQDTVLFNATVRFNLTYGARDASDEQVQAACRLAQVDSYIARLEEGFETTVGERGLRLSGGEKQRLGIARALLREPAVLVLDEATSALDTETERQVQDALDAASRGRCTLSIAHRLSTIVKCDEIVVLKAGVAVERGPHDKLIGLSGGLYASMWEKQSDKAIEKAVAGQGALSCHDCKCCVDEACCAPNAAHAPSEHHYHKSADGGSPGAIGAASAAAAAHAWTSLAGVVPRRGLPPVSRQLSRAYTLHAALARVGLLSQPPTTPPSAISSLLGVAAGLSPGATSAAGGTLRVHLLGVDAREGVTPTQTCQVFAPLCSLLTGSHWREVELLLCGPHCHGPSGTTHAVRVSEDGGQAGLRVRYVQGLYHELPASEVEGSGPPHLAVAFQAGVWGYDSWAPTIARVRTHNCPLVITSYNVHEAEDDEESLQQLSPPPRWRWSPQPNPWRSLEDERAHRAHQPQGSNAPNALFENGAWQCLS